MPPLGAAVIRCREQLLRTACSGVAPSWKTGEAVDMAGRPQRRAKLEQQAAIPEAVSGPDQGAGGPAYARTPPRELPRRQPNTRPKFETLTSARPGTQQRELADHVQTDEMTALARALRPGVQVRIERLKPTWCAGWVEDLSLDAGSLSELYEQLKEEWGGKLYRCTVLMSNGIPAFECRIPIAGAPKDEGKVIVRGEWDGEPKSARATNPAPVVQAAAPASDITGILGVFKLIMDNNEKVATAQMLTMRELSERSAAQNQGLIEAMLQSRTAEARGGSLSGQLAELMEANKAIERVKKNFGAAAAPEGAPDDEPLLQGAVREAAKGFFSQVIQSEMRGRTPQQAPQRRPGPPMGPRPVPQHRQAPPSGPRPVPRHSEIPEAV